MNFKENNGETRAFRGLRATSLRVKSPKCWEISYNGEKVVSVEIKFSRHAKRRAKLFTIPESAISRILTSMILDQGEHEIIRNVAGFKYPLKIVVSVEGDTVRVIK